MVAMYSQVIMFYNFLEPSFMNLLNFNVNNDYSLHSFSRICHFFRYFNYFIFFFLLYYIFKLNNTFRKLFHHVKHFFHNFFITFIQFFTLFICIYCGKILMQRVLILENQEKSFCLAIVNTSRAC